MVASQSPAERISPQHSISQPAESITISKDNKRMGHISTRTINMTSVFFFFWFDDSNLHYTHVHTVWGGQRGFEPLPNGGEFSLAPLGQMPSGQHDFSIKITFASYFWFRIISGAMYNGEPHRVSAKPWGVRDLANKSRKKSSVLTFEIFGTLSFRSCFCLIKVTISACLVPTQPAWVKLLLTGVVYKQWVSKLKDIIHTI